MNNDGKVNIKTCLEKINGVLCIKTESGDDVLHTYYKDGALEVIKNGQHVDVSELSNILSGENLDKFTEIKDSFIQNILSEYVNGGEVQNFVNGLRLVIRFFRINTSNDLVLFLKETFVNYERLLRETGVTGFSSNIKFFITCIVPEFMKDIRDMYNGTSIPGFVNFILTFVNDISFQSKIIDGLLNCKKDDKNKDFAKDILENFDFNTISINGAARIYAILSRQNANKDAIKILNKIHDEYLSRLSDEDLNKFTEFFCQNVNDINYFGDKGSINIANYSQTMINYFYYVSRARSFKCFSQLLISLRRSMRNVPFGDSTLVDILEQSLIEQTTKSMSTERQRENIAKLFDGRENSYSEKIVRNTAGSIFFDGLSSVISADFLVDNFGSLVSEVVRDTVEHKNLSDVKKVQVLSRNQECLSVLSKIKAFRKNFLNQKTVLALLNSKTESDETKAVVADFYKNKILFNKDALSKLPVIGYIQSQFRKMRVRLFEKAAYRVLGDSFGKVMCPKAIEQPVEPVKPVEKQIEQGAARLCYAQSKADGLPISEESLIKSFLANNPYSSKVVALSERRRQNKGMMSSVVTR